MAQRHDLTTLLSAACETAVAAGKLVQSKWSQPRTVTEKAFQDFVTDADIAAQKLISNQLRALFPAHGFLTEEDDDHLPPDGDIIWIIDPIDGTTNYSRQHPIFCVSVSAARPAANKFGFQPLVGVIYDPMQDELFSAAAGLGCRLNDQPVSVSSIDTLSYAVIGVDWSYNRRMARSSRDVLGAFSHIVQGVRSLGSASLAMAWVAAGRYDGYLNFNLKPWDIAAAWVLLQEAGGQISGTNGTAATWRMDGMDCFLSNGRIHDAFLQLLPPQPVTTTK